MKAVVVTDPPKASLDDADRLSACGLSTVHEACGRRGYLGPRMRPVWPGARIAGTAVTALCWPGDNWMIHVAVEQCGPGGTLVVATNSPCSDGLFGELLATSLGARGVRGVVLACGARDVAELQAMGFPAWSTAVSAQGSVKATLGSVNGPVVVEGQLVHPGDVIVADDGVVCVARADVPRAVTVSQARLEREERNRKRFQAGELGLDVYGMRGELQRLGLRYINHREWAAGEDV
ncbi:4-carboxy-4-hydroxy-2-oxoadipate aldolase/oxaloacetate decarboxylase [Streptomyces sp. NBC_00631]|uniref:4-carboxy-4-hydroxy-2-oxoadipate aldolase/oxaloacetate decarboxylase n=1 Tax=Streptomyces sp. NBC_00631 TaxID=2975793 RepID=UPI0030DEAC9C